MLRVSYTVTVLVMLLVLLMAAGLSDAFLVRRCLGRTPLTTTATTRSNTALFGISEWRDIMYNFPGTGDDRRLGREDGAPPKEICVLPFPFQEILLQGETKQLRLYEDRFIKLFDDAMDNYHGVVAMGLLADSGIVQTVPICEIEAYNRMGDSFGIFVTIRVVARGQIVEIIQQEPYIKAVCVEISDTLPPNLELPNLAASNIENLVLLLSSMEHRLKEDQQKRKKRKHDDDDDDDTEMQQRINIARLEDRFYEEQHDDNDEEEDDEEEDIDLDRRGRFRQAYRIALETDTQGYRVASNAGNSTSNDKKKSRRDADLLRTPQELAAISWAAFCTDLLPEELVDIQDTTYKIQALDCDSLFDRLKLALHALRTKKDALRDQMKKAGLKFRNNDDGNNDDSQLPPSSSAKN